MRYWADSIDWKSVSGKQKMSVAFLAEVEPRIHWGTLAAFNYKTLSPDTISAFRHRMHLDRLDWQYISNEASLTYDFIKEFERPVFKAGIVDGKVIDESQVQVLAKLPGKDGLIAMFARALKSPIQNLHGALSAPLRDLAGVLKQVSEKKA